MNSSAKISAVIITFNEEQNIARCLDSIQNVADEIIVVDSLSTDETKAICSQYNVTFIERNWEGYSKTKNWGNTQANFDFILSLDADEALSNELKQSILKVKKKGLSKAYKMSRLNFVGDKKLNHGGWYPDQKIRLFHKNFAKWDDKNVHESVEVDGGVEIQTLKGDLLHYSFKSYADHLITINKYSKIRVNDRIKKGKSYSLFKSCVKAKVKLLKLFFLKGGFKDGKAGWRVALNSSLRHFIEYGIYLKTKSCAISSKSVCFFNTTSFWGGGEKWHYEAANSLNKSKYNIHFVCKKDSPLSKKINDNSIKKYNFSCSNLSFINPFKIYRLTKYFKSQNINTVIFNGSTDMKTGGFAAFLAGVPNVIYRRGLASPPKGDLLNLFLFTSVITHFIVNSKSTLNLLCSKTEIPKEKLNTTLIYNSVNTSINSETKSPNNSILTLGIASRLVEQKGLFYLLEIANILKYRGVNFKLKIAGDGPLESQLKAKSKELSLDGVVTFKGFVTDISSFLSKIDIYLCTSIFEGFGFSMAEAMLHQKPVIAFNTSSNPEIVQHQETGFIVPAFDLEMFCDKVEELSHNHELRKKFGENGKSHVINSFSKEKQHQKLEALLDELIR